MTPCIIVMSQRLMPEGNVIYQQCLVPYMGPLPATHQIPVLNQLPSQIGFVHPPMPSVVPTSHPIASTRVSLPQQQQQQATEPTQPAAEEVSEAENSSAGVAPAVVQPTNSQTPEVIRPPNSSNVLPEPIVETVEIEQTTVAHAPVEPVVEEVVEPLPEIAKKDPTASKLKWLSSPREGERRKVQVKETPKPQVVDRDVQDVKNFNEFPTLSGRPRNRIVSSTSSSSVRSVESHASQESGDAGSISSYNGGEYRTAWLYRSARRVRVRADKTSDAPEVGILEKGTEVKLVVIEGKKGRIVEPFDGWVSMKKKKMDQFEQLFDSTSTPTICLRNIPKNLKSEMEVKDMLAKYGIRTSRIIWRLDNAKERLNYAYVEFSTHDQAQNTLKKKKKINKDHPKLKIDWSRRYAMQVEL
jgi:hypothetical protein